MGRWSWISWGGSPITLQVIKRGPVRARLEGWSSSRRCDHGSRGWREARKGAPGQGMQAPLEDGKGKETTKSFP